MTDSNPKNDRPRQQLNIKLDDNIAQGIYSNLVMVTHGESEFILDFMFLQPGRAEARIGSRVILSALQAKRLMAALGDNVNRYEQRFGVIPLPIAKPEDDDGTVH